MPQNQIQFAIQKKGYAPLQVDSFLAQQQDKFSRLSEELEQAQAELEKAKKELAVYTEREAAIQQALMQANIASEKIISEAEEAAKSLKERAEKENADKSLALKDLESMKKRLKYILQSQLALLENENDTNSAEEI